MTEWQGYFAGQQLCTCDFLDPTQRMWMNESSIKGSQGWCMVKYAYKNDGSYKA